jgi:sugar/nucleoside kinase (ribokinase family)
MKQVVGVGVVCLDFVSVVDKYPVENSKMRSREHLIDVGGNCGNAICALNRMGGGSIQCTIVSKVGNDIWGDQIINQLKKYGIHTQYIIRGQNMNSPFSYIMVNTQNQTRTIIHTPIPEYLKPSEINPASIARAELIFLDGRHVDGALALLKHIKQGSRVYLELERLKDDTINLIPHAHYILTSESFPSEYQTMFQLNNMETMDILFHLHEKMKHIEDSFLITTLGRKGSVCVTKSNEQPNNTLTLSDIISKHENFELNTTYPRTFQYIVKYNDYCYSITYCEIWTNPPFDIVDTTGAGDTYNGACLYWLATQDFTSKSSIANMMKFASIMAAYCASEKGTHAGIPNSEKVKEIIDVINHGTK